MSFSIPSFLSGGVKIISFDSLLPHGASVMFCKHILMSLCHLLLHGECLDNLHPVETFVNNGRNLSDKFPCLHAYFLHHSSESIYSKHNKRYHDKREEGKVPSPPDHNNSKDNHCTNFNKEVFYGICNRAL